MSNRKFIDRRKVKKAIPDKLTPLPGQLGNGNGQVQTNIANYVYCRIGGQVQIIFNSRVPPDNDTLVDVGYSYDASGKRGQYQVLGTRSSSPGGAGSSMQLGYPKAARYQLFAPDGGQDPIWLDKRQIINLLVWPDGGLTVRVYPGIVWSGDAHLYVGYQTIDLSSHVPATTGKAVMVLITVSTSGSIIATAGNEFTLADVTDEDDMLSHVPAAPENTAEEIAAVRIYEGQSAIVVSRTVTDILDLRFISRAGDGGSGIPDAPSDGKQYGREDGTWTEIVVSGGGEIESWQTPTLQNGWVNYGAEYENAGYYKHNGRVYLRGLLKDGSIEAAMFTLPEGYRPSGRLILGGTSVGGSFARLDIKSNGEVFPANGSNAYYSVSGVSFRVAE